MLKSTYERDGENYLMQTRAKQTYAMLKEATNGRFSANRTIDAVDDNGFFSAVMKRRKMKISRAAYGILKGSVTYAVINFIIYDCCLSHIAVLSAYKQSGEKFIAFQIAFCEWLKCRNVCR